LCGTSIVGIQETKVVEVSGDDFRLRLVRHTITLAKSKADADEERKQRQAEADQRGENRFRADSSAPGLDGSRSDVEDDIDDPGVGETIITTTIKQYLTYHNPFLYTKMRAHRYVVEAIYTGQTCGLLPSVSDVNEMLTFSDHTPAELRSNLRSQFGRPIRPPHFNLPKAVSSATQKQLFESIKSRLTTKRQASSTGNRSCADWDNLVPRRTDSPIIESNEMTDNHTDKSWLKRVLDMVEQVKKKHGLDEAQSTCYYFMIDRLILSLHRLPETNESRRLYAQKFLYMGGAGGTGKSQVIKAIVECFRQLECGERLKVSATTGVAADQIGGSTIDHLCSISRSKSSNGTKQTKEPTKASETGTTFVATKDRWSVCQFLILDEVESNPDSMK
jgi:hypothetical protein